MTQQAGHLTHQTSSGSSGSSTPVPGSSSSDTGPPPIQQQQQRQPPILIHSSDINSNSYQQQQQQGSRSPSIISRTFLPSVVGTSSMTPPPIPSPRLNSNNTPSPGSSSSSSLYHHFGIDFNGNLPSPFLDQAAYQYQASLAAAGTYSNNFIGSTTPPLPISQQQLQPPQLSRAMTSSGSGCANTNNPNNVNRLVPIN
jgi:hypothetical protein